MPSESLSNATPNVKLITEEEAALYDRQIRLWGLDAQNKLKGSRILILGMSGLAAEISKNIVLAGVSCLTIRSQAAQPKIKALNPMVTVTAVSEDPIKEIKNHVLNHDVVFYCLDSSGNWVAEWLRLSHIVDECRQISGKNIILFTCIVNSFSGIAFVDLGHHVYSQFLGQPALPSVNAILGGLLAQEAIQ
ncbi:unnamed protein product, partial [Protopolystoma xenopodis]